MLSSHTLFRSSRVLWGSVNCRTFASQVQSRKKYEADYDMVSPQLVEESSESGYKLYYQHGLQSKLEFDEFNDPIWYGQEGKELVARLKHLSNTVNLCDIFMLRDYHNHDIIGFNAIKRCVAPLNVILNTPHIDNSSPFNYVLRYDLVVSPYLHGRGLGSIIREHSKYLEDAHIGNYGCSLTTVQIKNVGSYNLQIKSSMDVISQCDTRMFYRKDINNYNGKQYKVETINYNDNDNELWHKIQVLQKEQLKLHNIINLSVNPIEIDKSIPLQVIMDNDNGNVLGVFQLTYMTMQIKSPGIEGFALDLLSKFTKGFDGQESDIIFSRISAIYIDYDHKNVIDFVTELISYCLYVNKTNFGVLFNDVRNPISSLIGNNEFKMCGMVGKLMSEPKNQNLFIKVKGLDDIQTNIIKSNPIATFPPLPYYF